MRGQSGRTAHPEMAVCQVQFAVPFETSKTPSSVVLAVFSSTIKRLSEYMILKILLLRSPSLLKPFESYSNRQRDQNQNQDSATACTNFRFRNSQPAG